MTDCIDTAEEARRTVGRNCVNTAALAAERPLTAAFISSRLLADLQHSRKTRD